MSNGSGQSVSPRVRNDSTTRPLGVILASMNGRARDSILCSVPVWNDHPASVHDSEPSGHSHKQPAPVQDQALSEQPSLRAVDVQLCDHQHFGRKETEETSCAIPSKTSSPDCKFLDSPSTVLTSEKGLPHSQTVIDEPPCPIAIWERMTRRLISSNIIYFVNGWGDGVTGFLLPYFETEFHVDYMLASLLFAATTLGYAIGTAMIERTMRFLGRFYLACVEKNYIPALPIFANIYSKVTGSPVETSGVGYSMTKARCTALLIASIIQASYFIIMGTQSGFVSMLIAYMVAAFGRAFLAASINLYVASTPKKSLGIILGSYGVGAFVSPLVCQTIMAQGVPWAHFYYGSVVLSAINMTMIVYAFRPTQNEYNADRNAALEINASMSRSPTPGSVNTTEEAVACKLKDVQMSPECTRFNTAPPANTLLRALSMPYQWAFSLFAWIYSGSETSTQGLIVTYLLTIRSADPNTVGYVSSGFWGGMAISRFAWGYFSPILSWSQKKLVVYSCIGGSVIAFANHLLIWFVDSYVENAFSASIIGFLYGPIFPATLALANEILPSEVRMVSMAVISTFASFGSALYPFIASAISNIYGIRILPYVTVSQCAVMLCIWFLFPSGPPTRKQNAV